MKKKKKLNGRKQEDLAYANCLLVEEKIRLQIENMRKLIAERIPVDGSCFAGFSESFSPRDANVFALSTALFIERDEVRANRAFYELDSALRKYEG